MFKNNPLTSMPLIMPGMLDMGGMLEIKEALEMKRGKTRHYGMKKAKRRRNGKYVTRTVGDKVFKYTEPYRTKADGTPIPFAKGPSDPAKQALDVAVIYAKRVKRWFKNHDPAIHDVPGHIRDKAKYVASMDAQLKALEEEVAHA